MTDQKNTILAIVLSALVLIAWQFYFGLQQMEKQKQIQQQQAQDQMGQMAQSQSDADNAQQQEYLTDVVDILRRDGKPYLPAEVEYIKSVTGAGK